MSIIDDDLPDLSHRHQLQEHAYTLEALLRRYLFAHTLANYGVECQCNICNVAREVLK